MPRRRRPRLLLGALAALALLVPGRLPGQAGFHPRWEISGFDFDPDGVWRVRARRVSEHRRALLARGDFGGLNAPLAARVGVIDPATAAAVAGTIRVPALLFSYQGVDSALFMRDPAVYDAALFGAVPPAGLPYTLHSYYTELSNGLLAVPGQAIGWARLDGVESVYNGGQSCQGQNPTGSANCNGIFSGAAFGAMQVGLRQALARVDASVDFGSFDNDGPDGVPNSADDDGFVDVIAFLHATRDGACGGTANNHLWAHRATISYDTDDPSAGGGPVRIRDYVLQSALGGAAGCDSTQTMPIGTMAHEFGHALGLPDLYDTSGETEGLGQWGLMGSGNWTSQRSPSRMEAWSLNEVGWVTLREPGIAGTYTLGPAPTADTAFVVRVQGANPRGELFLLENRQRVQADSAMVRIHGGGGLLIWHIDAIKASQSFGVNAQFPHGVALEQADGLGHLDRARGAGGNRGDGGDPYPGVSGNAQFSGATNPAAVKNADGGFAGFAIDSIRDVAPNGAMALRLRFGALTLVRASDTAAVVVVAGDTVHVYRELTETGAPLGIAVPDTQLAPNGRTRWRFVSWSDGGPRAHDIVGSPAGDTLIATLARDFLLRVTIQGAGTVTPTPALDLAGTLVAEGGAVALVAAPDAGHVFGAWTQDTAATAASITLPMGRPYTVTARFDPLLAIISAAGRPGALMGADYADTLRASGGSGTTTWSIVAGALPPGLALTAGTGRIAGVPAATGTFRFTAQAVSAPQAVTRELTLVVAAPALATAAVVSQLLSGTGTLTPAELRYLDLLGNQNSFFDVGDFTAWVDATGAPLAAVRPTTGRATP